MSCLQISSECTRMFAHLAKTISTRNSRRIVRRFKFSSLTENTREHVGKDRPFSDVLIVCQGKALLKTAVGVSADKMGHPGDNQLPDFSLSFRHFDSLWHNVGMTETR
jgi:hypothetical protein